MVLIVMLVGCLVAPTLGQAAPGNNQTVLLQGQDELTVTVADWSFEVLAATKASTFNDVIQLGVHDDGLDWLVVSLVATNTSDSSQRIHSDDILLEVGGEELQQIRDTGDTADELGLMSIGGWSSHSIDAGETIEVLQVFTVEPDATEFTLVFDFSGKWDVELAPLVEEADGSGLALIGEEPDTASFDILDDDASSDDPWTLVTPQFEVSLIGAAAAPTFTGPFHLGRVDEGQSWLVTSYRVTNTSDEDAELRSNDIAMLTGDASAEQADSETESVARELGIESPSVDIVAGEDATVVSVFVVDAEGSDHTLQIDDGGNWQLLVSPAVEAAAGDPEAVDPASATDLADIEGNEEEVAQEVSTDDPDPTQEPEPTPEPEPTAEPEPTPEPTEAPEIGTEDNPAGFGETIVTEDFAVAVTDVNVYNSMAGGFWEPRANHVYVVVSLSVTNVGDSVQDYGEGDFAAFSVDGGGEYHREIFNMADQPLVGGNLNPNEDSWGQVVYEVHQNADQIQLRFRPSLFGDSGYWVINLP